MATCVRVDLDETLADGEEALLGAPVHDDLTGHDLRDQPDVLRIDADLPVDGRERDHGGVFGEDRRLAA